MGKKYIIELEEPEIFDERKFYTCSQMPWWAVSENIVENLTPYTELDTEAAYAHGYSNAEIKYRAEVKEAYQKGLEDAWETVKKLFSFTFDEQATIFKATSVRDIVRKYSASEIIEKIRQYEQKEQESITAEDVMRQYLDNFCQGRNCTGCPLHTPDFTCGRGKYFLYDSMSNEEVRRAYTIVLAKMKETE